MWRLLLCFIHAFIHFDWTIISLTRLGGRCGRFAGNGELRWFRHVGQFVHHRFAINVGRTRLFGTLRFGPFGRLIVGVLGKADCSKSESRGRNGNVCES